MLIRSLFMSDSERRDGVRSAVFDFTDFDWSGKPKFFLGNANGGSRTISQSKPDCICFLTFYAPSASKHAPTFQTPDYGMRVEDINAETLSKLEALGGGVLFRISSPFYHRHDDLIGRCCRVLRHFWRTRAEPDDFLAGRNQIARSARCLMCRYGWSEHESYSVLRKTAMNTGRPLEKVADLVLELCRAGDDR